MPSPASSRASHFAQRFSIPPPCLPRSIPRKTQLDNPCLPGVQPGQLFESVIEGDQLPIPRRRHVGYLVEIDSGGMIDSLSPPSPLDGGSHPSCVYQNSPHDLGRDAEEVC